MARSTRDKLSIKYVNVPEWNISIGASHKVGSSTVYHSLETAFGVDKLANSPRVRLLHPKLVPADSNIFIFTRCPLDRFKSLWRNKCVAPYGNIVKTIGNDLHGLTPEQLWDYTLRVDNPHWAPLNTITQPVPEHARLVPLDKMGEWWEEQIPVPMIIHNSSGHKAEWPRNATLELAILDRYELDVRLHARAWRNYERRND